jgi:hypothetical protein
MNKMIAGRVSCCAWWTTIAGPHVAVVGTNDGTICFFSLPDGRFLTELNVQERIEKVEVVEDEKDRSKCLFVQAGMLYRLQLECEEETEDGYGLLGFSGRKIPFEDAFTDPVPVADLKTSKYATSNYMPRGCPSPYHHHCKFHHN